MLLYSSDCPEDSIPWQGICTTCREILIRPFSAIKNNLAILDTTFKTITIKTNCKTCGHEVYLSKAPKQIYENN
jgi:hypothetical protein